MKKKSLSKRLRYYRWSYGVSLSLSFPSSSYSCHCLATKTAIQSCLSFSLSVAWPCQLRCVSRERLPFAQHNTPDRSLILMAENKLNLLLFMTSVAYIATFWNVVQCSLVYVCRGFIRTYCPHNLS